MATHRAWRLLGLALALLLWPAKAALAAEKCDTSCNAECTTCCSSWQVVASCGEKVVAKTTTHFRWDTANRVAKDSAKSAESCKGDGCKDKVFSCGGDKKATWRPRCVGKPAASAPSRKASRQKALIAGQLAALGEVTQTLEKLTQRPDLKKDAATRAARLLKRLREYPKSLKRHEASLAGQAKTAVVRSVSEATAAVSRDLRDGARLAKDGRAIDKNFAARLRREKEASAKKQREAEARARRKAEASALAATRAASKAEKAAKARQEASDRAARKATAAADRKERELLAKKKAAAAKIARDEEARARAARKKSSAAERRDRELLAKKKAAAAKIARDEEARAKAARKKSAKRDRELLAKKKAAAAIAAREADAAEKRRRGSAQLFADAAAARQKAKRVLVAAKKTAGAALLSAIKFSSQTNLTPAARRKIKASRSKLEQYRKEADKSFAESASKGGKDAKASKRTAERSLTKAKQLSAKIDREKRNVERVIKDPKSVRR